MDKKRYLQKKIDSLLGMFPTVAVIGPRQCGKSTLVKNLRPQWKYYDLENPNDYHLITTDPFAFFSINPGNIIIDEAQQYPEIFNILRGIIDAQRSLKGRFLLTGSSSPEIVKGITESLAGRIATVEMWPFKQGELWEKPVPVLYEKLSQQGITPELQDLKPLITLNQSLQHWFRGGFPEPIIENNQDEIFYTQWMENYLNSYVTRDIRGLFPKLNLHAFRRFLMLLAQFSGHQLNMSDMARALEISVSTVKDYLAIIHQTFLWRNLEPYNKNTLKKIQKAKKGFIRDQGLLHYLLRIKGLDDLLLHPVAGFSFESFVVEEIIRGFQTTMATGIEFNYYRTIDKSEVDLIVEGFFGIVPIEIKLNSLAKKRTLRGLENFISDMNAKFGLVINRGQRIEWISENILQIPVNYI
ncbi:MAG: ATP-binding protein [Proteobacteria bacterium]|nr:ATP-binding protein [Pseudomonadota bacterium]